MSPELESQVKMFVQAVADRCKSCFVSGRCNECFSFAARRLLNDMAFDRARAAAAAIAGSAGQTAAERYILDQLNGKGAVRGNHLETLYPMSVREKRELLALMVQRGLVTVERRGWRDKNYSYYSLPSCNAQQCSTRPQSPTPSRPEPRRDPGESSPERFTSASGSERESSSSS